MNEQTTPQCLGFIMDGNRRWAQDQGQESLSGHQQGLSVLHQCVEWVRDNNIPHAVFYAFSTENWKRSQHEVAYLMDLLRTELRTLADKGVLVRMIGRREDFAEDIAVSIAEVEEESLKNTDATTTIWIAASYGGRAEIVSAVNEAVKQGEVVTEETFTSLLWTADMPDPDMIIRTSGEQRLSNFLTWQSTYSELHFIDKHWPALTRADFDDILVEYENRNRRRGA